MQMILLLVFGPAVLAFLALVLGSYLAMQAGSMSKGGKILAWCGIVLCSVVTFGIGGCYAVVYTKGIW